MLYIHGDIYTYIYVCAVLQPVGNEGCSQPCFLSMRYPHSPLLAFSGPIPSMYQRRSQEFTQAAKVLDVFSNGSSRSSLLGWRRGIV